MSVLQSATWMVPKPSNFPEKKVVTPLFWVASGFRLHPHQVVGCNLGFVRETQSG